MSMRYRGRFAPTPSGPLHFGSLTTALASWLDARQHHGEWWLRIDDIDPPREQTGAADTIRRQLDQLGLHWDHLVYQHTRLAHYAAAVDALLAKGLAFHCRLSRTDLALYPAGHPGLSAAVPAGPDTAVRLIVPDRPQSFHDLIQPDYTDHFVQREGAFVIRRRDGLFAYHLACAVDDAELHMTHVLRGADLLESTPQQVWLMTCLDQTPPRYGHLPLAYASGAKLSKSHGSLPLDPASGAALLCRALEHLGLAPPPDLLRAGVADILDWGVANWSLERLATAARE